MENKNFFGHSTEERQEINMYTCKLCSSAYVWPDSLKRHLKYKHNMQESEALRQQQQQQQQEMPHEQQQESLQQQEEMIQQQQQQEMPQQQQQQREMPQQQHEMQQQQQDFSFQHPFTANVSGPTCSGKTYFVKMLLQPRFLLLQRESCGCINDGNRCMMSSKQMYILLLNLFRVYH